MIMVIMAIYIYYKLVGGIPTPLKNISQWSSWHLESQKNIETLDMILPFNFDIAIKESTS